MTSRIVLTKNRSSWLISVVLVAMTACLYSASPVSPWPPALDQPYPDIPFMKADGSTLKISDFKGRYVVIHYRGMSCPACQNMAARRDLMWRDPRVMNVDVLLFNNDMKPPTAQDAAAWAKQYQFVDPQHEIVVSAPAWTHASDLYQTTYKMVIGGQLLDKQGIVRASVVTPKGASEPPHLWPRLSGTLNQWLAEEKEAP